jgi:outer membrane beta-barrel protein
MTPMTALPSIQLPTEAPPSCLHSMRLSPVATAALWALGTWLSPADAQTTTPAAPAPAAPGSTATEQVIQPQVVRRDLKLPKYPSNDWELGLFGGVYGTQNFGASGVSGLRVGYHITEDVFVEGAFGRTTVNDESFRQILPGGVFVDRTQVLSTYSLSAGYNLFPGEVFWGRNRAFASQIYLIGGVGSTRFGEQRAQTFNLGVGVRVLFGDRFAARVDMRNHSFPLDLLGRRQNTQNLELTTGVAYLF